MGGFRSLRESLLLAILCFAVCNEVICVNINSRAVFEEPVLPESTITVKMPGTRPVKVGFLLIRKITSRLVMQLIELHDRCCA